MNLSTLITQLEAAAREATNEKWETFHRKSFNGVSKKHYSVLQVGYRVNPVHKAIDELQTWSTICRPIKTAEESQPNWENDAKYIVAAQPQTILQLTQALREAVEILEHFAPGWNVTSLNETVPFTGHGSDPVRQQWRRYVTPQTEQARDFLARWKGEGTA